MVIKLAYGKSGMEVAFSDDIKITVIEPRFVSGLEDPEEKLKDALRSPVLSPPLKDLVKPGGRVGVVFNDITRATPYRLIMPVILEELKDVPGENITLFNALGTHRKNTEEELSSILGREISKAYRIVQNDAFDRSTQVSFGSSSRGNDIWLNREFIECDVKILTGFIEPHFFAGFSGGGKAVMPGMSGLETIMCNHSAGMIDDERSSWGITRGNPIWEEIREVALKVENTFLINVALNKKKEITGIFAGSLADAHNKGCEFVKKNSMAPIDRLFDIVITTNSGYPLDLNLYQAVKGMSAACNAVKEGGAIIVAADCWDGIPEHGLYGQILKESESPGAVLKKIGEPGFHKQDQWQVQIQARIQLKSNVYVRSDNLTDGQIESVLLKPCRNIDDTVEMLLGKYGPEAGVCVLPEGPQTIPYLQQ